MRKSKKNENYLEKVPKKAENITWDCDGSGLVTIHIENKGIMKRLTQILLKKPKVSHIHLDEIGSFVWLSIDGRSTIGEIAPAFEEHFGERVRPTNERLCQFVATLVSCGFAVI